MSQHRIRCARLSALACLLACASAQAADYTLTIEPIYPPEKAQQVYKPLVEYLAKATGEHFTLVTPKNYHLYWRAIRQGPATDFAYDEAHLVDYRIKHAQFEPLVRSAEPMSYTLLTSLDANAKGINSLVGHAIVSMPAPSLGYALLIQLYPNPVLQPDIRSSASSWRDALETVFGGDADAAMVPTTLKDQYPNLTALKTSRTFAGPAVTAGANVPRELKTKVRDALLKLGDDPTLGEMLLELGISKFVAADPKEYDGDEKMLKDF